MYLKSLTISGFKSFAKKSELEFSAPITAIVGPNGSGKSNVAEAFRFVLGEQSIKSMRGKRGEDLIFNGSDNTARGNRAHVSVALDNTQSVFPVDFQEVVVERTVHRDGVNEYTLNNAKVRLKDVQEVLASANIGSTGHHIISQGEADRILSASPKERREMIEDALGLKVYQYKKIEAEKKLKKTQENIERVQSLRREVAPHLKFLHRQVQKVERSIQLRKELEEVYAAYLKREDIYLSHRQDTLTQQRIEPDQTLATLKEKLATAKKILSEDTDNKKNAEVIALEEKLSQARSKKQELLRTSGQYEGELRFLERRIEQLQKQEVQEAQAQVSLEQVQNIVRTIEQSVQKAVNNTDASFLQRALTDVVNTLRKFVQSASGKSTVSTDTEEQERADIQKKQKEIETQIAQLDAQEEALSKEYEALKQAIEQEQSQSKQAQEEVFTLMAQQRECENTLARIDQELQEIRRDREEFTVQLQEAVALLGRGASQYRSYEIVANDTPVSEEDIVTEDREKQRERRRSLEKMKIRLEELGGSGDDVVKEYTEVKERDEFLVREITDLEDSVQKLEELITDLTAQLNEQFIAGIDKIGFEFNRFFMLMFGGGQAKIVRVKPKVPKKAEEDMIDEEEEVEEQVQEGIELDVKLPNKRVSGLDMLSGGERALTSIALIFAMSQVNPPLFIILDETDAALDEANSRRYGDMIEALAEKSQLILITHNRETMSRAGILYGVTMGADGVSKLLSVKLEEAIAVAK